MNCIHCHQPALLKTNGTYSKFCSLQCRSKYYSTQTIEKRKASNLKKYGVENPFQLKAIQEKQQQTVLEKYGVKFAIQNDEIKEKQKQAWGKYTNNHPWADKTIRESISQTLLEKYGVLHPILNDEINQKIKNTCLDRYGVSNYAATTQHKTQMKLSVESRKKKQKETTLNKYGVEHFNQIKIKDQLVYLNDSNWLSNTLNELGIVGVSRLLNVSIDTVNNYKKKHDISYVNSSGFETKIYSYIKSIYTGKIERNIKISKKEIDIYIPDLKIGFECNGTYWHSELNGRDRYYHISKTNTISEQGIHLIHLWEHNWNQNINIVKSMIASQFGINHKIYARQCKVKLISSQTSKEFFKNNHLQGACNQKISYGLYAGDILVAAMSFAKARFNKNAEWELMRYANMLNTNVIGGASKLIKHFVSNHNPKSIISYSNKEWATGNMYKAIGFSYFHTSPPAYHYTRDYKIIENRIKYQKHKLRLMPIFNEMLSEWENMKLNGYDRIWDCGNDTWILTIS